MSAEGIRGSEVKAGYINFLVVTIFFYLLFAGFLVGTDLYYYDDPGSALSVLLIYGFLATFTGLYLLGNRYGLLGVIALCAFLLILQVIYIVAFIAQPVPDPTLHSPFANIWVTALNSLFPAITLLFSVKTYKEI